MPLIYSKYSIHITLIIENMHKSVQGNIIQRERVCEFSFIHLLGYFLAFSGLNEANPHWGCQFALHSLQFEC